MLAPCWIASRTLDDGLVILLSFLFVCVLKFLLLFCTLGAGADPLRSDAEGCHPAAPLCLVAPEWWEPTHLPCTAWEKRYPLKILWLISPCSLFLTCMRYTENEVSEPISLNEENHLQVGMQDGAGRLLKHIVTIRLCQNWHIGSITYHCARVNVVAGWLFALGFLHKQNKS